MPEYNDGNVPYGFSAAADLYVSPANATFIGAYVLESLTFDQPGFQIDRRNGSNVMAGRVAGDDSPQIFGGPLAITATATLQRALVSTPAPQVGNAVDLNGAVPSTESRPFFVVTGVTQTYAQAEAHQFSVTLAGTSAEV